MILVKSVQDKDGAFVGLLQFRQYFETAALRQSIVNTLFRRDDRDRYHRAARVRLRVRAHAIMHAVARLLPRHRADANLAPSLLSAISFIQWFGTQGLLKGLLGATSIYGPVGIILSSV